MNVVKLTGRELVVARAAWRVFIRAGGREAGNAAMQEVYDAGQWAPSSAIDLFAAWYPLRSIESCIDAVVGAEAVIHAT